MLDWNSSTLAQKLWTSSNDATASATASTTVSPTQGFHITSSTTITNFTTLETCSTALLQLVPPNFIVDEYELDQRYKEGYGPLCHVVGEKALERPVEAVGNRSALILAEFSVKPGMTLDIPLHLRYAKPQKDVGVVQLELPWPWVIAVCDQPEWNGRQFLRHLFQNEPVRDYTILSPPRNAPHPTSVVLVPTGDTSHQSWVEIGTLLSVWLTFLYVSWCLFKAVRTPNAKIKTS
ncbi:hypothetical protein FS749_010159 [Ceratobasidium sp. UAMH 11750]|nr:hypothetical protein FS749_010159 [Ceratobasidium sp. UAMH 11750]